MRPYQVPLDADAVLTPAQQLVNPPIEVPAPTRWFFERPFLALHTGGTTLITVWIICNFANFHRITPGFLCVLAGITALLAVYSMQIGVGSLRWCKRFDACKDVNYFQKWVHARVPDKRNWHDVRHFVIVTCYKEHDKFLKSVAYTLMAQGMVPNDSAEMVQAASTGDFRYPPGGDDEKSFSQKHIYLVFAMEESAGRQQCEEKFARIKKSVGGHFAGMILTIHPDPLRDYPDGDGPEIRGKASNYRWAAKEVDDFVRDNRIPAENCIVTVADYDSLFDPNHFPYMTYEFCTRDDVDLCVWQPCMMPTLNFWMIYPGVRQFTVTVTAQEMMSACDGFEFKTPFSSYGYPLKLLRHIGGGHAGNAQDGDVITEDFHLFIKGFFATQGRIHCQPIFLPCFNYTEQGLECLSERCKCLCTGCLWGNWDSRFTQAIRHTSGVSEFAYFCSLFLRSRPGMRYGIKGYQMLRLIAFFCKLLKLHTVSYIGLWTVLAGFGTFLMKECVKWCRVNDPEGQTFWICQSAIDEVVDTTSMLFYWVAVGFVMLGTILAGLAFTKLLRVTQHRIEHIANPSGAFTPARQRLVEIGEGGPWFGIMLQLTLEQILFGFAASLMYGWVASLFALKELWLKGHRMKYVSNKQNV